jgi:hypothetical protein
VRSLQNISVPGPKSIGLPNDTFTHSIREGDLFTKRKPGGMLTISSPKKAYVANNKKGNKIIPIMTRINLVRTPSPALPAFSPYKSKRAGSNYCSIIQKCSLEDIEENEESAQEI